MSYWSPLFHKTGSLSQYHIVWQYSQIDKFCLAASLRVPLQFFLMQQYFSAFYTCPFHYSSGFPWRVSSFTYLLVYSNRRWIKVEWRLIQLSTHTYYGLSYCLLNFLFIPPSSPSLPSTSLLSIHALLYMSIYLSKYRRFPVLISLTHLLL